MKSVGEVKNPKEEKQNKNKQLSNENRLKKQKGKQAIDTKWGGGGMYYVYRSFPIDANCFRSQRNKRKTELALGGKTLLVTKLDKCSGFFFKC